MLLKIHRKTAALQPVRTTTTIFHFLAPCVPNARRRIAAFLHFRSSLFAPLSRRMWPVSKRGRALPWGRSQIPSLLALWVCSRGRRSRYFSSSCFSAFLCVCAFSDEGGGGGGRGKATKYRRRENAISEKLREGGGRGWKGKGDGDEGKGERSMELLAPLMLLLMLLLQPSPSSCTEQCCREKIPAQIHVQDVHA